MYTTLFLLTTFATYAACVPADVVNWYTISYWTPPDSKGFVHFSGNMEIPKLPHAGVYYLWPGLQETKNIGVYQEVLDGTNGAWWFAPGWYTNDTMRPSSFTWAGKQEPWGRGFSVQEGDVVSFNNTYAGSNAGGWFGNVGDSKNRASASTDFAISNYEFNQALFAIELHNQTWDFGPLKFSRINMQALGNDTSWCTSTPPTDGATKFTISGVKASILPNNAASIGRGASSYLDKTVVSCSIDSLIMEAPTKPAISGQKVNGTTEARRRRRTQIDW
ncbi:MAG: hypothetical protein M1828_004431 [Chrysothrix sp. TS-e1954]|nr:MAG: hypothetical protein M1828_004431 [Chrysothrix sp. TS-e1954]